LTLSTLVVCEAGAEKLAAIEALVNANADLSLLGAATMHEAFDRVSELDPKVIWIELTPDPDEGIKLLVGVREKWPALHCLVSNDKLDADLVKTTMQAGAADFLDAETWNDQLSDVVERIILKDEAQREAREKLEADRRKLHEMLELQKQQPTSSKTNLTAMKKMVTDPDEIQGRAVLNLGLLIVLVLLTVGAFFVFRAH